MRLLREKPRLLVCIVVSIAGHGYHAQRPACSVPAGADRGVGAAAMEQCHKITIEMLEFKVSIEVFQSGSWARRRCLNSGSRLGDVQFQA